MQQAFEKQRAKEAVMEERRKSKEARDEKKEAKREAKRRRKGGGSAKTPKMAEQIVVFWSILGLFGVETTGLSGHHWWFGTTCSEEYVYIKKSTICP